MLNGVKENIFLEYFGDCQRNLERNSKWEFFKLSTLLSGAGNKQARCIDDYAQAMPVLRRQSLRLHADPGLANEFALRYLSQNLLEGAFITKHWPHAIFLDTNVPELSFILPSLPKLYIFSGSFGATKKPWFVPNVKLNG